MGQRSVTLYPSSLLVTGGLLIAVAVRRSLGHWDTAAGHMQYSQTIRMSQYVLLSYFNVHIEGSQQQQLQKT